MTEASTPSASLVTQTLATRLLARIDIKPIAALSAASLALGGLIVLAFFVRIRFMPDADLASSTAILFAVALVGLASMATYLFVALLPGVVTAVFLRGRGLPLDRGIGWVLPGTALVVTGGTLAAASTCWPEVMGHIELIWLIGSCAAGGLAAARAWTLRARSTPGDTPGWLTIARDFGAFAVTAVLWFVGVFFALQLAVALGKDSGLPTWLSVACAVAWTAFIAGVNVAAGGLRPKFAVVYAALCMLPAAITLIMMSGGTGPFASYVLRQLGMGELDRVELVVEPAVCRSLALAAAPEFRCDATNAEGAGVLRGLTARSRIGTQVVVEPQRASAEGGKVAILPQLILRKSDIVLWVRR
ncbi:MAG: hypothetical protein JSR41_02155 [Proteobacteria bacterium]|nr:hypothetical protein [Pseudomonadota bacterium]